MTVRGVERLDGDEGFAEVFLDDVFVPDADVLGEPNQGGASRWRPRAPSAALRCGHPVRFMATAQRLIDLARDHRDRAEATDARDRLVAAWIDAQAYRWQTFWTVTRIAEGADRPGVQHGEGLLVGARHPDARVWRSTCSGRTPSCSTATTRPG